MKNRKFFNEGIKPNACVNINDMLPYKTYIDLYPSKEAIAKSIDKAKQDMDARISKVNDDLVETNVELDCIKSDISNINYNIDLLNEEYKALKSKYDKFYNALYKYHLKPFWYKMFVSFDKFYFKNRM